MKADHIVNITELRNRFDFYLAVVKRGGEVIICERNVPFAKISPLKHTAAHEIEEIRPVAKELKRS